jgi:uncharacterized protein YndB with AHSA1/START domain
MEKLFVEKSIEINAEAKSIWKVLIQPEYTKEWIEIGWGKGTSLSSDWNYGSEVLWKNSGGDVIVNGKVTSLNPYKLLRFTVRDVSSAGKFSLSDEDGITYELIERNGFTTFMVRQGDFSVMKEGEKYRDKTDEIWNKVMPKVKELAEADQSSGDPPTCGKGLAENSVLPARFSEIMASMAENLELHMHTLDFDDPNAKLEHDAYEKLVKEHKDIATRLMTAAHTMYSYYNLPSARHDEDKLSNPAIGAAFKRFNNLEEELTAMLKKRMKKDKRILAEIGDI